MHPLLLLLPRLQTKRLTWNLVVPLIGTWVFWSLPVGLLDGDEFLDLVLDRDVEVPDCQALVVLHFQVVVYRLEVALQGGEVDDVDYVVPEDCFALRGTSGKD